MTAAEYYFTRDHSARRRTILLSVFIGAAIGGAVQIIGASSLVSAMFCVVFAGVVQMFGIASYKLTPKERRDRAKRDHRPTRRYMLQAAYSALAIAVLGSLRIPRIEAATLNRKLREATNEGPEYQKVTKIIRYAVKNRVSLDPSAVSALQRDAINTSSSSSVIGDSLATASASAIPQHVAIADVEAYKIFSITGFQLEPSGETIVLGKRETYELPRSLPIMKDFTLVGIDRDGSIIVAGFTKSTESPAVLMYRYPVRQDCIVAHLTFLCELAPPQAPESIIWKRQQSKLAVYQVNVTGLVQYLDNVIWVEVACKNCRLFYDGGSLHLYNVSFENCRFESESSNSQAVLDLLRSAESKPVTLSVP